MTKIFIVDLIINIHQTRNYINILKTHFFKNKLDAQMFLLFYIRTIKKAKFQLEFNLIKNKNR